MTTFDLALLSGRFDRPPRSVRADMQALTDHDVIVGTEMGDSDRAAALVQPDRTLFRGEGHVGRRECFVSWRDDFVTNVVATDVDELTAGGGSSRLTSPLCATTAVLDLASGQRLLVSIAHMPAHVEGEWNDPVSTLVPIYKSAMRTWRVHVEQLIAVHGPDAVWVGGDWNLNARRDWVADFVRSAWPGYALAFPGVGTHGTRAIDGGVVRGLNVDLIRVTPAESSDHRVVRTVLTIPAQPPVTLDDRLTARLRALEPTAVVLSRPDWGSNPDGTLWPKAPDVPDVYAWRRANKPHGVLPAAPVGALWQHITVTADSGPLVGDFERDMRTVERIGFDRFGSGVSYNLCVGMQGEIGLGMPLDARGTHTVNSLGTPGFAHDQNRVSLAVAYLANDGDTLTPEAEASIALVIRALLDIGALAVDHQYVPHSLVAAKTCPTTPVRDRMTAIRQAATDITRQAHAQAEVARIIGELELLSEHLENAPPDRTPVHQFGIDLARTAHDLRALAAAAPPR